MVLIFNFIVFTKGTYSIGLSLFRVSTPFNVLSYGHLALVLPNVICHYDWLIRRHMKHACQIHKILYRMTVLMIPK